MLGSLVRVLVLANFKVIRLKRWVSKISIYSAGSGYMKFYVTLSGRRKGKKRSRALSNREVLVLAPFDIDSPPVHGTQTDRLDLTASTQKSVLKNINQNVLKYRSPNQTCILWDVLANISGPIAYLTKSIFMLKLWAQAGQFEYHEPYKRNNSFFSYKRADNIKGARTSTSRLDRALNIFSPVSMMKCNQKMNDDISDFEFSIVSSLSYPKVSW